MISRTAMETHIDCEQYRDSMPFDGFVGVNYSWQDDVTFDINQDPKLFDEQYTSGMSNGSQLYGVQNAFAQMLPRNALRYWGVSAQYTF
jgi:hypothetical protein